MNRMNLLIVDDEPEVIEVLESLFDDYLGEVFSALAGNQALDIIQNNKVDLVICDISMPELGGVELIKHIRELGFEVPFIFYTAYYSPKVVRDAAKYGVYDFVSKPNLEELFAVTVQALENGISLLCNSESKSVESSIKDYKELLKKL